jgi:hypothetical protein
MKTDTPGESAKIYQFPARGCFAADRDDARPDVAQRYAKTAFGGGWYHDEAIQEERARTKN